MDRARQLAQSLPALLLPRGEFIAFAESCTGGLLAKLATDVAGSSGWFERGLVTYSNAAKHELLDVPTSIFETDGAVSEFCVRAMATGLIARAPAQWGVAITGIAGPGGGSAGRPVGTVWIAWVRRGSEPDAQRFLFLGDRESVREQSAVAALEGLVERATMSGRTVSAG
ncbi:MAG: CinA family protein [Panacagrimonas sp.]